MVGDRPTPVPHPGDACRTHSGKMRSREALAHCAGSMVKE
jgi:hypothetical protein